MFLVSPLKIFISFSNPFKLNSLPPWSSKKVSIILTLAPKLTNFLTKVLPIKPAPPVTRIFCFYKNLS